MRVQILPRHLAPWAGELLEVSPVLVIEGARQVGKSTLAAMLSDRESVFATMDDDLTRGFARDDPQGFLRSGGACRLIIDEAQRCPELILPLKAEVDRDRRPGRFVLTGSANLLKMPGAEDSLAGRAMTVRLHPFSQGEVLERPDDWVSALLRDTSTRPSGTDRADVVRRLVRGGYPTVQAMGAKVARAWFDDYLKRLIERDSADIGPAQIPTLRKLLSLVSAAPGAELVLERLADSLGIARGTVARYLDILDALFLIHRLPAWSRNLTSRQVGRPKVYLTDAAIASTLTRATAEQLLTPHGSDYLGPLVENFVVCELLRQQTWSTTPFELSHYRDRNGAEVDIIVETPQGVIAVEVKTASTARTDHFKHLVGVRDRLKSEFLLGVVFTLGEGGVAGDRLLSMPVSSLWTT